jgi:dihydroorotate dehydrogenase (NAD+) catalytic subunit
VSAGLDRSVEFAGLRLNNPVIAASGTFGYGLEWESILDLNELGGLVTKGLSRQPMRGNPPPRLAVTPTGMLNFIGLQNVGVDAFIREKLRAWRSSEPPSSLTFSEHRWKTMWRLCGVSRPPEGSPATS